MKSSLRNYLTVCALSIASVVNAQEVFGPKDIRMSIEARPVNDVILINGILDEVAWSTADSVSDFIQVEPEQGMLSRQKTIVKVLYSDLYLYVGVFCFDSLGKDGIRVPDMTRDFEWKAHDMFAICIDGFNDKRNGVTFATNAVGAQKDYLSFDDVLFDSDWNGMWTVRTSISNHGWFAEFQIPFKTIRYAKRKDDNHHWGINFLRMRRASNEISVWSPYPRSLGFNRMEYAGIVTNIVAPSPSTNVQLNPYGLIGGIKNDQPGPELNHEYRQKIGGELKWAINSNTIADLTINTDFAQADADLQVNNVSRFSVLFPEKRQFFLENASLFGPGLVAGITGGNMQLLPFFSRRIGLGAIGNPLPIQGGVRLASRSIHRNIGFMAVRQPQEDSIPILNYAVGRYSLNVGSQNRVGIIGTAKSSTDKTNLLGGIDGFIRFNASHSLNFMALHSTDLGKRKNGIGGYAQYYFTNNHLIAWITESFLTEHFNPELGFVSRSNVIGTTPGAIANFRGKFLPLRKYIRAYQPSIMTSWYHQANTRTLTEREIRFAPFKLEMQDGGYYEFAISNIRQNLMIEFNPLQISISEGEYNYQRYLVLTGTDPSRKLSYTAQYDFGKYYNGRLNTFSFSASIIPMPNISIKVSLNANEFKAVGRDLSSQTILLLTLQGRLALNPRLQLTGLYQRDPNSKVDYYNVRIAWEYKPLSYVYIVINSREQLMPDERIQKEQQGIFKVSYLRQF